MVSKLPSSSLVSTSATSSRRPAASSSNTGVCRTLFHHRDIGARFPSRSASTTAVTLQKSLQESSENEVVVKDCNGNFDVQTPCLPPHEDDQSQDEFTERESTQENIIGFKNIAYRYIEIDTRLLEMYKNRSLQPGEPPAELFSAIQSSLKRTVTSLDEDNWIFEPNSWS